MPNPPLNDPYGAPQRPRMSSLSVGLQWASTVTTIGLEAVLPLLAGVWLDRHYDAAPLWMLTLGLLGFLAAGFHLSQLARRLSQPFQKPGERGQ